MKKHGGRVMPSHERMINKISRREIFRIIEQNKDVKFSRETLIKLRETGLRLIPDNLAP